MMLCVAMVLLTVACNAQQKQEVKRNSNEMTAEPVGATTESGDPAVKTETKTEGSADFNYGYMVLPGFTPTGNKETDDQNYSSAKEAFVAKYPDDYAKRMEEATNKGREEWVKQQPKSAASTPDANSANKIMEVPRSRYNAMTPEQQKRIDGNPQFKIVEDK